MELDAGPLEVGQLLLDGRLPGSQVLFEVGSVAVFESVFELIERGVLGIEQIPIPSEEVVVQHLGQRHGQSPLWNGVGGQAPTVPGSGPKFTGDF